MEDFYTVTTTSIKGNNGSEFSFEGIRHNVNTIRSYEGVDRVWVEEANTVSKKSWEVLIPTIRKDNSEIWISFNPEFEDDETFERFVLNPPSSAIVRKVNYKDNPWFPKVLEEERLELLKKHPDDYDYVWEGNCRKWLENAIYASELRKTMAENRVTHVPFDPAVPVFTAWDLGHTDSTCIWWYQIVGQEIHVLECYGTNGGSVSEYASQVLGRHVQIDIVDNDVKAKFGDAIPEIAHRQEYRYERHWLPHDARAKTLAAAGKSIIQQLCSALTIEKCAIVPDIGVEDGIQAARMMFGRCWFDANGTVDGMKALRRYQRKEQLDGMSLGKTPLHDWTSHFADAFRMASVAWQEARKQEKPKPKPVEGLTVGNYHKVTLNELWKQTETQVERY
jgi:phage terminase large subunit